MPLTGPELATRLTDPYQVSALFERLPNPDPVLRKLGREQHVYEAIGYDAHVMGELRSIRAGLLGFEWRLAAGGEGRKARLALDLARELMARPPAPDTEWRDLVWTLACAVFYGYSVHEIVWERDGQYLLPARILDRPQTRFLFAAEDNALRLLTRGQPVRGEPVPPMRFLLARHMPSFNNPYGVAVFSSCFWPYLFKHGGFRYFVSLCEKYGLPWVVGTYPEGSDPSLADELKEKLEKLVADVIAVVPDSSQVRIEEPRSSTLSATPQERLINLCNRELSKALTSQTLATEIQGQGSRAASQIHRSRERSVNQSDREIVSGALNRLFRWITDLNFGPDIPSPRHEFYEESEARGDWAELLDRVRHFLPIARSEAYERLGLTPPREGEDLVEAGSPAAPTGQAPPEFGHPRACPGCGAALEFASLDGDDWDRALEAAIEAGEDPQRLLPISRELAQPLLEASQEDPEMLLGRLAELYPSLDGEDLQDLLGRVIFVAETWGRMSDADA